MMKLYWSPTSPFVRKVMIAGHETGLLPQITCVRTVVAAERPGAQLTRENPLSKVPTLVLDDGMAIFDSRVIAEYLDTLHDRGKLFPAGYPEQLGALRWQALGDGTLDFLVLWRGELRRRPEEQSAPLLAAWRAKLKACLATIEKDAPALEGAAFATGHIGIGAALGYLDFRFPDEEWRSGYPVLARWHEGFARRPSALATEPADGAPAPEAAPDATPPARTGCSCSRAGSARFGSAAGSKFRARPMQRRLSSIVRI
ncbi:MAG: glutathione S-transferase family protein, partial [Acetobacteraceae bacterium]